jgi:hypothetical protein
MNLELICLLKKLRDSMMLLDNYNKKINVIINFFLTFYNIFFNLITKLKIN